MTAADGAVVAHGHEAVISQQVRLAAVVAAAGGHHAGFIGDGDSGVPVVARFLHSLLSEPDPHIVAQRSVAVAGFPAPAGDDPGVPLVVPHHTCSLSLLLGGGIAGRPGAVSLAHGGVLHLADAPEFPSRFLHALVPALVRREVTLARGGRLVTLPAGFQLVTTARICGCFRSADSCRCTEADRRRYRVRAWPLVQHLDIRTAATGLGVEHDVVSVVSQPDERLRSVVSEARRIARQRWDRFRLAANAHVGMAQLRGGAMLLSGGGGRVLMDDRRCGALSRSGYLAVTRVAWTVADLAGRPQPSVDDVMLARRLHGLG